MANIKLTYPSQDYGGKGDSLHFLHANGYPPGCYQPLLDHLTTHFHVFGMVMRPLRDGFEPGHLRSWQPLSDELNVFLENCNDGRVVAFGHSLGAVVSLRAAIQNPKKYRALILIDPVIFPPAVIHGWKIIKRLGLGYKLHPLIPTARKRRARFENLEIIFRAYRQKKIFRYINDENLRIMITGMVKPSATSGFELSYSPAWEVQIYYTGVAFDMDLWDAFPKIQLPLLIIRGAETNTFLPITASRIRTVRPETKIETLQKATHLVPLEKPREVSDVMISFLESVP